MARPISYTQCRLCRPLDFGTAWRVSWIPAPLAHPGQTLRMRSAAGDAWEEGWLVESTYSSLSEEEVRALSHLHTRWREANDG